MQIPFFNTRASPSLLGNVLYLLSIYTFFCALSFQICNAADKICNTTRYPNVSQFETNLNTVLSNLVQHTSSSGGYNTSLSGQIPNRYMASSSAGEIRPWKNATVVLRMQRPSFYGSVLMPLVVEFGRRTATATCVTTTTALSDSLIPNLRKFITIQITPLTLKPSAVLLEGSFKTCLIKPLSQRKDSQLGLQRTRCQFSGFTVWFSVGEKFPVPTMNRAWQLKYLTF